VGEGELMSDRVYKGLVWSDLRKGWVLESFPFMKSNITMAHNWNHGNLTFGNIEIIAMVNFPSAHALHLTTQEMVTVASFHRWASAF
jgi:hypothetical protein